MEPLKAGFRRSLELKVDPDLALDPKVRAKLVESAMKLHMAKLAYRRFQKAANQKRNARAAKSPGVDGAADEADDPTAA